MFWLSTADAAQPTHKRIEFYQINKASADHQTAFVSESTVASTIKTNYKGINFREICRTASVWSADLCCFVNSQMRFLS